MTVEIKEGVLFIDATDRSMGFTLTLKHVSNGTSFSAELKNFFDGEKDKMDAAFRLRDGVADGLGIKLEENMDDLVWFDRVQPA